MSKLLIGIVMVGFAIALSMQFLSSSKSSNVSVAIKTNKVKAQKSLTHEENNPTAFINVVDSGVSPSKKKEMNAMQVSQQASQKSTSEKLYLALARVPDTYHSIFHWAQEVDKEMVNEYTLAASNQDQQLADMNLEQQLNDFIFQHELSAQVEIEVLRCTSSSCEVYGKELSSSAWGVIKEDAKQAAWWTFSKDATRNAMGTSGEMVFLTIIRE